MKIKKSPFFPVLVFILTFSNVVKSDEVCSLSIRGKEVRYQSCSSNKKYSKLKSVLIIQLEHALTSLSEQQAIVKRDNPIYGPKDPNYNFILQNSQWEQAHEVMRRAKNFAKNSQLKASELKFWNKSIKSLEESMLARKNFSDWKNEFTIVSKKMLQDFSNKKTVAFNKKQIAANQVLRDILATKYWDEKVEWQAQWSKIPKGKVTLGSSKNQQGHFEDETEFIYENPNEFEIQTSLLTQEQWVKIMGSNPSRFRKKFYCLESAKSIGGIEMCPDHPVENVSGNDVEDFLQILSLTQPLQNLRLPTHNEWEFAAKGLSNTIFWFGSSFEDVEKNCWAENNSNKQSQPINTKPKNPFGLADTCGNVWQLTKNENNFGIKGGSWTGGPRILRPATKRDISSDGKYSNVGFRLVLGLNTFK